MPGNGGKRPGAGRPPGSKNRKTLEIEELARQHTPKAMEKLVKLVDDPKHPAHFSAIKELLDRGYGKPKQSVEGKFTGTLDVNAPWLKKRGV